MAKVIMSLSGGLDSAVLLSKLLIDGHEVIPVNFQYGSKHNPHEWKAAKSLAFHYKLELVTVDVTPAMGAFNSKLMDNGSAIPEGHYEEETMRDTVVPGRNLIFLSILAGMAESEGCEAVAIGVHAGDHHIYPDCRPEFVNAAAAAIGMSTNSKVIILAPFIYIDKTKIVQLGEKFKTPFHLTRTCYAPQTTACGKCGSCQERLVSFFKAGIVDPIDYHTRDLLPKA